jgi:hypothetical protein
MPFIASYGPESPCCDFRLQILFREKQSCPSICSEYSENFSKQFGTDEDMDALMEST